MAGFERTFDGRQRGEHRGRKSLDGLGHIPLRGQHVARLDGATVEMAKACYKFTRGQKEVLATANLANAVESIVGMLPI